MASSSIMDLKNILEKKFRKYFPKRIPKYGFYIKKLKGLSGIEIGGPSLAFTKQGFLPIYQHIESLDGCNFSSNTIWEGQIESGRTYHFENKVGHQYILDGSALTEINNEQYDFLLSCHNLEHIANPIKALKEWKRVLKPNGYLLMILPHKDKTFDHKRPITKLEHILQDYEQEMQETDSTHFEEVLTLHDITRDAGVEKHQDLVERTSKNGISAASVCCSAVAPRAEGGFKISDPLQMSKVHTRNKRKVEAVFVMSFTRFEFEPLDTLH
jgi:SAM-dependent methyltransferase